MKVANRTALLKWQMGTFLLFLFILGWTPLASAEKGDLSAELMLGFGFGPDDPDFEFDSTFGPGAGLGYEVVDGAQLRVDASYFTWDDTATVCDPLSGVCRTLSLDLRNIPVFIGGRFFAPLADSIHLFAELGLSANFLEAKLGDTNTGVSVSESQTKIGLVPGLGIEFRFSPQLALGGNVRYHLISKGVGDFDEGGTAFMSAAALVAYYF